MKLYKKSIWSFRYSSFFSAVFAVFMLCFLLSPLAYILKSSLSFRTSSPISMQEMNETYRYIRFPSIVTNLPENETNTNTGVWISRGTYQEYQRLYNGGSFVPLIPFLCICLSVSILLLKFRKTNIDQSEIALCIGGHAPPCLP